MNKIAKSYKCCILCLKSPNKVPGLKLHRFPTDKVKINVWLNACGLEAEEYLPNRRLCSRHFDKTCYTKSGSRLKLDAIPTKYLKGQIIRPFFQLSKDKTTNDDINSTCETDQLTIQPSESETVNISNEICSINESIHKVVSPVSTHELQVVAETLKKKKNFIGKIKTPDFATPKTDRKSFILAKTHIKMQKNKIQILNQKVNSLKKELSSLKLLMSHLKQKKVLSKEAHDNILEVQPRIQRKIKNGLLN
ncbi:uncharacterized protein LOC115034511 isoform X2 [Acyrthosiphon pisum]|uniref:THAP-type domain-containing protein n=1 Tax=Acyrthosiphon pisum TaxID=7029 RepID=A0A8R2NW58_ACYPI|nr:uncharacterized protein LOC115034511 isoform X2 [Acyrthosiphon pisum]